MSRDFWFSFVSGKEQKTQHLQDIGICRNQSGIVDWECFASFLIATCSSYCYSLHSALTMLVHGTLHWGWGALSFPLCILGCLKKETILLTTPDRPSVGIHSILAICHLYCHFQGQGRRLWGANPNSLAANKILFSSKASLEGPEE